MPGLPTHAASKACIRQREIKLVRLGLNEFCQFCARAAGTVFRLYELELMTGLANALFVIHVKVSTPVMSTGTRKGRPG